MNYTSPTFKRLASLSLFILDSWYGMYHKMILSKTTMRSNAWMVLLLPPMVLSCFISRLHHATAFVVAKPTAVTLPRWRHARRPLHASTALCAKPQRGAAVDRFPTVSVKCATCGFCIFRYKKKNGTKSNLIKCYVERIVEDCGGVLNHGQEESSSSSSYACPSCQTTFARPAVIRGMPALKLVGGKTRMSKK